jgi:RNA polymerase sigma-70 factor (ECF subfamily)
MASSPDADAPLLSRIHAGDQHALGEFFARHRERLLKMVRLRIDRRLEGRLDPEDVVQEAFLDAARRLGDYAADPRMPPFLWLRFLTIQRLQTLHRLHLGAKGRDASREISLFDASPPAADSRSLAAPVARYSRYPGQWSKARRCSVGFSRTLACRGFSRACD